LKLYVIRITAPLFQLVISNNPMICQMYCGIFQIKQIKSSVFH